MQTTKMFTSGIAIVNMLAITILDSMIGFLSNSWAC